MPRLLGLPGHRFDEAPPWGLSVSPIGGSFKVALGLHVRPQLAFAELDPQIAGWSFGQWMDCDELGEEIGKVVSDVQKRAVGPLRAYPSWMQGSVGRICYNGVTTALPACANYPRRRLCLLASRLILDKDTTSFVVRSHA